ncbi:hypothetical protein HanPSC8_Chr06g0238621 [Helianthus annuus]|nr:hypothetical protein HanPSC8_Chr06g0238621 [Helianthus annuus]
MGAASSDTTAASLLFVLLVGCGNRWFCHSGMIISKVFFQLILAWQ